MTFMKSIYQGGLGASETALFSPNAVTTPLTMFAQGKLAMAVGSNYYTGNWTKFIGAPYWAQAAQTMGVTPMPTQNGGGIASTLGGWTTPSPPTAAIPARHSSWSPYGEPAEQHRRRQLGRLGDAEQGLLDGATFVKFAPYQGEFAKIRPTPR